MPKLSVEETSKGVDVDWTTGDVEMMAAIRRSSGGKVGEPMKLERK